MYIASSKVSGLKKMQKLLKPLSENCVQNEKKNKKSGRKCTHLLDAKNLRLIRQKIGFAPRDMCQHLNLPRRTYQDYEAGKRSIPDDVAQAVLDELEWNKKFLEELATRVDTESDEDFPEGIPSMSVSEEDL